MKLAQKIAIDMIVIQWKQKTSTLIRTKVIRIESNPMLPF